MRVCLLLALSCTVGVVHAAPASDGAVKTLVTRLGMGGLGTDMAELTVKSTPSLSALDDAQRVCARKPIQDMIDQGFRSSMIAGLGDDGAQVVADWAQFLDTSAGKSLASVFAGSNAQTIADRAGAGLDEKARAELDTFLRSLRRTPDGRAGCRLADARRPRSTHGERPEGAVRHRADRRCRFLIDSVRSLPICHAVQT